MGVGLNQDEAGIQDVRKKGIQEIKKKRYPEKMVISFTSKRKRNDKSMETRRVTRESRIHDSNKIRLKTTSM